MKQQDKFVPDYETPKSVILDVELPVMICGSNEGYEDEDTPSPWKS